MKRSTAVERARVIHNIDIIMQHGHRGGGPVIAIYRYKVEIGNVLKTVFVEHNEGRTEKKKNQ